MSGFTRVDNNILEEVSRKKFNATQLSIIMIVWRMTTGYNREDHELAVNYFVKATGFSKRNIQETINNLIESKVLIETQAASFNQTRKIAFNKNTDEWLVPSRTKSKQVKESSPHEKKFTSSGEGEFTSSGDQLFTQERNIKENIKKEEEEEENPIKLFESNFGIMTPFQMSKLWDWVDDFKGNKEVVCLAVKEVALKNPRSPFIYLERILQDWNRRKLFTADDVLREKQKYEESKVVSIKKSNTDIDWEAL